MLNDIEIMQYFEMLRNERKINIQDVTKGIISRRNYSRYLSGECPLNLKVFSQLLNRIGVPLNEFSFFITNRIILENLDEINFHDLIRMEKYERAYKELYPKIKNKHWKSIYAERSIPMGIALMRYKHGEICVNEAKRIMAKSLKLDEIINRRSIHDDDIEALFLYIRVCDDNDKDIILKHILNVFFDKSYKMAVMHFEFCTTLLYIIALYIATNNPNKYNEELINKLINNVLEYHTRAKPIVYDVLLFEILYKYVKANKINNKYIIFYYIATILSTEAQDFLEGRTFEIRKEDIDLYLECLDDEDFMKSHMYERLINYDIL